MKQRKHVQNVKAVSDNCLAFLVRLHILFLYIIKMLDCWHIFFPLFKTWDGLAQWLASQTTDQGVPGSRPGRGTVCYDLEQVTFTHCLVPVEPRKPWADD